MSLQLVERKTYETNHRSIGHLCLPFFQRLYMEQNLLPSKAELEFPHQTRNLLEIKNNMQNTASNVAEDDDNSNLGAGKISTSFKSHISLFKINCYSSSSTLPFRRPPSACTARGNPLHFFTIFLPIGMCIRVVVSKGTFF